MPRKDYKLNKVPEGNVSAGVPLAASWRSWFEDLYRMVGSENNYSSEEWIPTITGLAGGGSTVISDAKYFKFRKMLQFSLVIEPHGSISSILGTTYISALPKATVAAGTAHLFNATTRDLIGHAYIESGSDIIYLPTWLTISDNISLSGFVFVDG